MTPDIRPLSDFDAVRRRLESAFSDVLRSCLDRLEAPQVYILTDAEAGIPCRDDCGGFTASNLDVAVRAGIADRWRGRGPAVVVSSASIRADDNCFDACEFASVVTHEAAHVAEFRKLTSRESSAETIRQVLAEKVSCRNASMSEAEFLESVVMPAEHGISFLRSMIHIADRVRRLDPELSLDLHAAYPCRAYLAGNVSFYVSALRDELRRYADVPLADVLDRLPPVRHSDEFYRNTCKPGEAA